MTLQMRRVCIKNDYQKYFQQILESIEKKLSCKLLINQFCYSLDFYLLFVTS